MEKDAKKKILFADYDIAFIKLHRKTIEDIGFSVCEAYDGDGAIKMSFSEKPNIIIINMEMPIKSGIEVMKEIRSDSWGKNIPIIILGNKDTTDKNIADIADLNPTYCIIKGNKNSENVIPRIISELTC